MSSPTPDRPATPDPAPRAAGDDAPVGTPVDDAAPPEQPQDPAPQADAAQADDEHEEPQDVTLLVDPGRIRRAPKYPVFLWVGALVGAVAGLIFSTWLIDVTGSAETLMKPGVYVGVTVLGGIALGLGVAGLLAVIADRRSLRRR